MPRIHRKQSLSFSLWKIVFCLIVHSTNSNFRSSRPEVFCRKGALKNFPKFTGKHLCQSLFYNKVAGLGSSTLFKKRPWHRCFPLNFAEFLTTPFLIEHLRCLFLYLRQSYKYVFWCLLLYLRQSYKYVFCYMAFDKAYIHQTKLSLFSVFVQIRVSLRKFCDKMKPFLLNVPSNVLSRSTISS